MEKKTMLTFGAFALLAVLAVIFAYGYFVSYSAEELQAEKDAVATELAAQNAKELENAEQAYQAQLSEAQEAYEEYVASKAEEIAALQESYETQLADLEEELDAANEELATDAEADELYPAGKVVDDLFLGDVVDFSLDDGDITKLVDGKIEFDEEDYDVHEEFAAQNGDFIILYSAADDEEFGANPYLGLLNKGAIEYRYVFDDPIDMTAISDDEPLQIVFLGQDMEIVAADANEVTFRSGSEFFLQEGDSIVFDGKTVALAFVSENGKVTIEVDGVAGIVEEFDSETINGVDVRVEDILINSRYGAATLVVGEDTLVDQKDGDEWVVEDSQFVFTIVAAGDDLLQLSVAYDEKRDELDDTYPVLGLGDSIVFPNEYLTILFNEILYTDYVQFDFAFDGFSEELWNDVDVDKNECMVVSTDDDNIEVLDDETDEVYICSDGTSYYQDNTGEWYEALVTDVTLVNDNAEYELSIGIAGLVRIEHAFDVLIRLNTNWANECFGAEEDEAEDSDVILGAATNVGNTEYDILTPYGAVLKNVEGGADNDEFSLSLPSDRVELELVVY